MQKNNNYTYEFHLKKKRKINHLKELLEKCNIKYTYIELENGTIKIKFKLNVYAKDLYNCFDISEIGVSKAKEIIEEMSLWDGHKSKNGRVSFSNTNKEQVNFYSIISVIAGYSHYQYKDKPRNDKWNDIYCLIIYIKLNRNFKQKRKETKYYNGKVHCVDIGGKLCVFRKDGKSFVAYNCMGCPYGSYKHDTEKELALINKNQRKFVEEYFKESYEILKIKTKEEEKWQNS